MSYRLLAERAFPTVKAGELIPGDWVHYTLKTTNWEHALDDDGPGRFATARWIPRSAASIMQVSAVELFGSSSVRLTLAPNLVQDDREGSFTITRPRSVLVPLVYPPEWSGFSDAILIPPVHPITEPRVVWCSWIGDLIVGDRVRLLDSSGATSNTASIREVVSIDRSLNSSNRLVFRITRDDPSWNGCRNPLNDSKRTLRRSTMIQLEPNGEGERASAPKGVPMRRRV